MTDVMKKLKKAEKEAVEKHAKTYGTENDDTKKPDGEKPEGEAAVNQKPDDQKPAEHKPTDTQQPVAEEQSYKEKYLVLQGKYNAEVPRLSTENRQLKEMVTARDEQINNLQSRVEVIEKSVNPEPKHAEPQQLLSEDMLKRVEEDYGPDFMKIVTTVATNIAHQALADTKKDTSELRNDINSMREVKKKSESQIFWDNVKKAHPDVLDINQRDDFKGWLMEEIDPVTGDTRNKHLVNAQQNNDSARVIKIIDAFKKEIGLAEAAPKAAPKAEPEQDTTDTQIGDDRNIAPSGKKGGEKPNEKPVYTVADWSELQNAKIRGEYKGREEEYLKKEREIHAAIFGKKKAS